jgi:hypothetical protein
MALRKSKGGAMASGWEFLPEAVRITLIRASIKANCRTLSQAWIGHARRRIGARARHAANSAGLPMLPPQRIGIAVGGLGGSIQDFGHASGSGEQCVSAADETEATPPLH